MVSALTVGNTILKKSAQRRDRHDANEAAKNDLYCLQRVFKKNEAVIIPGAFRGMEIWPCAA